ncbi:MAG: FAD-dependent oxidoreductase, partial [Acidimicrobiales bacterium]
MSTSEPSKETPIVIYGATWCPDCRRAKQFLITHRVPFTWIDLETQPEQVAEVESRNGGKRIIPTIVFPDGSFLAEPSNDELADRIGLSRTAALSVYDVVIVGGGPTGLTTAIYAARENAKVLIVEKSAPGGQAGITERFDNYPGFPDGVGGQELAERMTRQAERYGVEILPAVGVTSVVREEPMIRVELSTGDHVLAPVVLVATGSTYRRTDAQ